MSTLSLRPIQPGDEPFLYRLYASTRAEEMALVDWSDEQKRAFLRMQFDAQHRFYTERFSSARFDVIELDGSPIGRLYLDRRDNEIRVIDISLLPEHRGKGLGGELMRKVLQQSREAGLPVTIHVEQFNPAMRLYQRLGFREVRMEGIYRLMEWRHDAETHTAYCGSGDGMKPYSQPAAVG